MDVQLLHSAVGNEGTLSLTPSRPVTVDHGSGQLTYASIEGRYKADDREIVIDLDAPYPHASTRFWGMRFGVGIKQILITADAVTAVCTDGKRRAFRLEEVQ